MREAAAALSCGVVPDWLDRLDDDLDDMEAALDWSMRTPERAAKAHIVVRSLDRPLTCSAPTPTHTCSAPSLSCAADYEIALGDVGAARAHVGDSLHQAQVADCASCESLALVSQTLLDDEAAPRFATAQRALRLAYDIGEPWGVLCALEAVVAGPPEPRPGWWRYCRHAPLRFGTANSPPRKPSGRRCSGN
jgi:hypothetical protein